VRCNDVDDRVDVNWRCRPWILGGCVGRDRRGVHREALANASEHPVELLARGAGLAVVRPRPPGRPRDRANRGRGERRGAWPACADAPLRRRHPPRARRRSGQPVRSPCPAAGASPRTASGWVPSGSDRAVAIGCHFCAAHTSSPQSPTTAASVIPGHEPLTDECGVLKSAGASIHTTPMSKCRTPARTPGAMSHEPAGTIGVWPLAMAARTRVSDPAAHLKRRLARITLEHSRRDLAHASRWPLLRTALTMASGPAGAGARDRPPRPAPQRPRGSPALSVASVGASLAWPAPRMPQSATPLGSLMRI
jgi:hypothetical protein